MIQVDDRVGSRELADPLKKRGLPVEVTRLEFGDFAWLGNGPDGLAPVAVERKTIGDLLSCITSERFSGHQLQGLHDCYQFIYLLVEGIWKCGAQGELLVWGWDAVTKKVCWHEVRWGAKAWLHRQVTGFLATMVFQGGMVVGYTTGEADSARWIHEQYAWWTGDQWDDHKSIKSIYCGPPLRTLRKPRTLKERVRIQMIRQLPKIGDERAWNASDHFGSVRRMVGANETEWQKVKGIGPGLAKSAVEMMG